MVNKSELAEKMLEYERLQLQLGELEKQISDMVMEIGETFVVGNVRATYSSGRRSFDYETPGSKAPANLISKHSEVVTKIDWRGICKEAGIEPVVVSQSEPSVSLRVS